MEFCRELNVEEEQQLYTLYIFGFWEPWVDQQRAAGEIQQGEFIS